LLQKILRICEPPRIEAAKNVRAPIGKLNVEGCKMRAWMVAIAAVVAIGLIWSIAVMSNLVPVDGSETSLASISRPAE
jgi:hypothetical protein